MLGVVAAEIRQAEDILPNALLGNRHRGNVRAAQEMESPVSVVVVEKRDE